MSLRRVNTLGSPSGAPLPPLGGPPASTGDSPPSPLGGCLHRRRRGDKSPPAPGPRSAALQPAEQHFNFYVSLNARKLWQLLKSPRPYSRRRKVPRQGSRRARHPVPKGEGVPPFGGALLSKDPPGPRRGECCSFVATQSKADLWRALPQLLISF